LQTGVLEISSVDFSITFSCLSYFCFHQIQWAAQKLGGSMIGSWMIFLEGFVQFT